MLVLDKARERFIAVFLIACSDHAVGERGYAAWDAWVLGVLRSRYGLQYDTTSAPLLRLFRAREELWRRREP